MFTGLIQATGKVRRLDRQGESACLQIASELAKDDLQLGESIAVNGVCLTLVSWDSESFVADVSPETLLCSTLGSLRPNMTVNLERALRLCDRLGGHLVSGHIDSVARITRRYHDSNAVRFEFSLSSAALRYVVEKGSVAIDGISLTVNTVDDEGFSVAVIPHSLERTTLQERKEGELVNVETDLLGRYVERLLQGEKGQPQSGGITLELLAKNGFL